MKSLFVIVYFALLANCMHKNNLFIINLITCIVVKFCPLHSGSFLSKAISSSLNYMSSYKSQNFSIARSRRINTVQTLPNVTCKPVPYCLLLISSPCVCKKPHKSKFQEFKKFKNPNFFSKLFFIQILINALGGPSNG